MASNSPNNPKKTDPGPGGVPRIDTLEIEDVHNHEGKRSDAPGPDSTGARRLRETLRREDPADEPAPVSKPMARSPRPPPVTVDQVGDGAVRLARAQKNVPHRTASKVAIEKAPLDTRAAFILSLVDGDNSVEALVDMSGMSEADVTAILARLARLGLISLP